MAERHLTSRQVMHICGDVSFMSLWRWQNDPATGFPVPIYIGRRRFWRESDIVAWLDSRADHAPKAA